MSPADKNKTTVSQNISYKVVHNNRCEEPTRTKLPSIGATVLAIPTVVIKTLVIMRQYS